MALILSPGVPSLFTQHTGLYSCLVVEGPIYALNCSSSVLSGFTDVVSVPLPLLDNTQPPPFPDPEEAAEYDENGAMRSRGEISS